MKLIFIAGPYIGDGSYAAIERNIREAEQFAIALANRGIGFFCPHLHTEHFEIKAKAPETFYKELDFEILDMVIRAGGALLALPRWQSSSGARAEVERVRTNGRPIFFPESPDDMDEIEKWAKE